MYGLPCTDVINAYLECDDYKGRMVGEYWWVRTRYEKLHKMIIQREAGKLTFTPNSTLELWKMQAKAMGAYLFALEVRAECEGVDLYVLNLKADG